MSGVKDKEVTVSAEEIRRAEEERQRRAEEWAQRQAECQRIQNEMQHTYEQAVAHHQKIVQQVTPLLHDLQSLQTKTQTQVQQIQHLGVSIQRSKLQLQKLESIASQTGSSLSGLKTSLDHDMVQARQLTKDTKQLVERQSQQVEQVQRGVAQQIATALSNIEKQQTEISNISQQMEWLSIQLQEQEEQANKLALEMSFLEQEPALLPATMMTLTAMETNGYSLSEILPSRQGLIAYFEADDKSHVIAVRHQPLYQSPFETKWEMLAEAFYFSGDEYLDFMNDFIDAAAETGFGRLTHKGHTLVPPKKPNEKMILPLPKKKLPKKPVPGSYVRDPEKGKVKNTGQ